MALSTLTLWRCNLFPLDFFVHSKRRLLLSEQRYLCDKGLCLKVPVSAKSAVVEERIRASVTHAMHICWIRAEQREAIKWEEQESWKRCAPTSTLTASFVQIKTWFVHDGPSRLISGPQKDFAPHVYFLFASLNVMKMLRDWTIFSESGEAFFFFYAVWSAAVNMISAVWRLL